MIGIDLFSGAGGMSLGARVLMLRYPLSAIPMQQGRMLQITPAR
jgi:hypothetical protein